MRQEKTSRVSIEYI